MGSMPDKTGDASALVRAFFESGKPLSAAKAELPHSLVSTKVLLAVLADCFRTITSLKGHDAAMHIAEPVAKSIAEPTTEPVAEKKEDEKLCASMWVKKECPGEQCVRIRKHLSLCSRPSCYGKDEARKGCPKWHGHIRTAIRLQKAKEIQQFQAW